MMYTYIQGMYLKYFYLKNSICNAIILYIILYMHFNGAHANILYFVFHVYKNILFQIYQILIL